MKIHEITLTEAAPGSFAAKAGVFGRAFGRALSQQMFGAAPGGAATGQPVAGVARQDVAGQMAKPMVAKISKQLMADYQQNVLELQKRTPNPATGTEGVPSPAQVPLNRRIALINGMTNNLLSTLSNQKIKSMVDASNLVADIKAKSDPKDPDQPAVRLVASLKDLAQVQTKIANEAKFTLAEFEDLAYNCYTIASMSTFQGTQDQSVLQKIFQKITAKQPLTPQEKTILQQAQGK